MRTAAAFLIAAGLAGQPVFRADTRAVEVTVSATRSDGSLIPDLRKDEIRVFDNDREQTVLSFEKIAGGTAGAARNTAPNRPPQRLSVIVLDALNTGWGDQIYGREAVSKLLETLPPGERIAIFALGDTLHLLHDFSTDYESLREAVDEYEGERPFGGVEDSPNRMSAQFHDPRQAAAASASPSAGFDQENRIYDTLQALTRVARGVQRYSGQKNLLWVSTAFPLSIKLAGAPESFHKQAAEAMQELSLAKLVLYPIDPSGVTGAFSTDRIDGMKELAEPTGGRVFYASNDVTALVRAALDDSHEGYLLTFSPSEYREDGSFHELRLKTSRKGAGLNYRRSYVASPSGR